MGIKKVFGALGKAAPVIAGIMSGGTLGPVAAGVAKQVGKALNLGDNPTPEDIEAAVVKADPAQLAELRRIDADLEAHLAELGFKRDELVYKDRDSARKREMAVRDSTPRIFAWVALGGFLGTLLLVILRGMPDDKSEPLIYVGLTALGTILSQVAAYYYGSSSGSKEKTQAMADALKSR